MTLTNNFCNTPIFGYFPLSLALNIFFFNFQDKEIMHIMDHCTYRKVSIRTTLPIEPPQLYSGVSEAILRSKIGPFLTELWPFFCCNLLQPPHTIAYPPGGSIGDFTVHVIYGMTRCLILAIVSHYHLFI